MVLRTVLGSTLQVNALAERRWLLGRSAAEPLQAGKHTHNVVAKIKNEQRVTISINIGRFRPASRRNDDLGSLTRLTVDLGRHFQTLADTERKNVYAGRVEH